MRGLKSKANIYLWCIFAHLEKYSLKSNDSQTLSRHFANRPHVRKGSGGWVSEPPDLIPGQQQTEASECTDTESRGSTPSLTGRRWSHKLPSPATDVTFTNPSPWMASASMDWEARTNVCSPLLHKPSCCLAVSHCLLPQETSTDVC